jgi:hypothetical protein
MVTNLNNFNSKLTEKENIKNNIKDVNINKIKNDKSNSRKSSPERINKSSNKIENKTAESSINNVKITKPKNDKFKLSVINETDSNNNVLSPKSNNTTRPTSRVSNSRQNYKNDVKNEIKNDNKELLINRMIIKELRLKLSQSEEMLKEYKDKYLEILDDQNN